MDFKKFRISSLIELFNLKDLASNQQSINFIIVNVLVAFFGFVRSFAFLKFLKFEALGILTLIQTGAMLIVFFQIGLITGAYRILALQKKESAVEVNNIVFSYIGVLCLFLGVLFSAGWMGGLIPHKGIVGIAILTGLLALVNNWLTNTLIASRSYKRLNNANLISAVLSLVCLPLAFYYGAFGGAVCIAIQPVLFILVVFLPDKSMWPTQFIFDIGKIKNVLRYGFIPYLSGLFLLLYVQIERWSITAFLSTTTLGNLYLVYLLSTMWLLIPASILNIFFPKAAVHFENKDFLSFGKNINKHFIVIITYCLTGALAVVLFLSPVVKLIFPQHLPFVKYAILSLPGLMFRSMIDPINSTLNSVVKFGAIFWNDISALAFYVVLIGLIVVLKIFTLTTVIICFDMYFAYKFIYLFIAYLRIKKRLLF